MLEKIDKFHKTRVGYLVFGLVELGLGVVFANWALAEGEWFDWLLAFVLLFGALQNGFRFAATFLRSKRG